MSLALSTVAALPGEIRAMEPTDFAFVWETSLKVRKPHETPWREWSEANGRRFREAIEAPGSYANVMESAGVLIGFAHVVGAALAMLYVKRDLRGFGFGAELVRSMRLDDPIPVTRANPCWRRWAASRNLHWREV